MSRSRFTRLVDQLSERDRAVLNSVAHYGFMTGRQLEVLHFSNHATPDAAARICRRVLARLRRDRLLEPLERRIGGLRAGSASYIWRLGPAGDRLLRLGDSDAPRARRKEPSLHFLDHRLSVAQVACELTAASRQGDGFELVQVMPEPASWRYFSGNYGGSEILKPDLFAVTAEGDSEDHWFIEVDRGTESLPTLLGQCDQYERYRRSGTEQAVAGLFPRVIWLVPDEHRAERLLAGIGRRDNLDQQLFKVCTYEQLLDAITNYEPKGGADA